MALHAIQRAIEPALPLREVLDHWNQIEMDLRERKRHRIQGCYALIVKLAPMGLLACLPGGE
jgi:hypothetical protein